MFKKVGVVLVMVGVLALTTSSCTKKSDNSDKVSKKEISILYPNWLEGICFTHLAKAMLEEKGYKVKITALDPGPIYASLAKGGNDLMMDAWLPNTHKSYWDKFGSKLDKIGESFSGGTTGLVVPEYVRINSITELNANKEKFSKKIIGIGSGAGIHANTEKVIKQYGLDFKQITSSGPAMIASLKKAILTKKPIIITGWKPHLMWNRYKLKYLEDPKKVYPKDVCAIVSRKGFKKDFPKLAKFFAKFNLTESDLYALEKVIDESKNKDETAKKWYNKNKTKLDKFWD